MLHWWERGYIAGLGLLVCLAFSHFCFHHFPIQLANTAFCCWGSKSGQGADVLPILFRSFRRHRDGPFQGAVLAGILAGVGAAFFAQAVL